MNFSHSMFKFPSLQTLFTGISVVIRRFPVVVLMAALNTATLMLLTKFPSQDHPWLVPITLTCFLAIPLFISGYLIAERRQWSLQFRIMLLAGIAALLVMYYFSLGSELTQRDYYRFGMFLAGAHLWLSFAPFLGYDEPNGFWHFNKTLLVQLFGATLYTGTLFVGVIIAIETIRFLFGTFSFAKITLETNIFILTFFFLHPLFFLTGLPQRLETLETQTSYSNGVKMFTQYVLLPLVVVYLFILYVYSGKILVQWQLPQGGVAYLVMAFSVAGIFALLLVYPLREATGERWIRLFTNRFYLALFPLIILLFAGIFRRIHDYGITENRYLVAALAVWLAGIALYFLISKKEDIRWIPISLFACSVLLAVGPWSIFSVSRRNQTQRFEALLARYHLLDAKGTLSGKATLPPDDYDQLLSVIRYFRDRRESKVLRPYFNALPATNASMPLAAMMEKKLQSAVNEGAATPTENTALDFSLKGVDDGLDVTIKGFDRLLVLTMYGNKRIERGTWEIQSSENGAFLTVFRSSQKMVSWNIADRINKLEAVHGASSFDLDAASLTFEYAGMRLVLETASRNGMTYSYQGVFMWKE